jgi:hypothetical protein
VIAIFRASVVYSFDLFEDRYRQHKIVSKFAYLSPLYHSFVNVVDRRFIFVLIIVKNGLDVSPSDLFIHAAAIFDIEYYFFDRYGPVDFGVFDCRLIY